MARPREVIKFRIDLPDHADKEIAWTFDVLARHFQCESLQVDSDEDVSIGHQTGDIRISDRFLQMLESKDFNHEKVFLDQPLITENGQPDYLGTCFYMLNSLQEYGSSETDRYGRFMYQASYQQRFNCCDQNLVAQYFSLLVDEVPGLKKNIDQPSRPSSLFITHDIDRVFHSFKAEGRWALQRGRLDKAFGQFGKWMKSRPDWLNVDDIIDLHTSRGISSSFLWLPKKGKDEHGIPNADYDIQTDRIQQAMKMVDASGSANGLHKSTFSSSFDEEAQSIQMSTPTNRNHYLKCSLPHHYHELEKSNIKIDSSLGFSEELGFRNSYGLPFHPFNLKERKPFKFLEVPLNIMDVTLFKDEQLSPEMYAQKVIDFIQMHPANTIITLLWHNNYITRERYLREYECYVKLLDYIKNNNISTELPEDIWKEYS